MVKGEKQRTSRIRPKSAEFQKTIAELFFLTFIVLLIRRDTMFTYNLPKVYKSFLRIYYLQPKQILLLFLIYDFKIFNNTRKQLL